MTVWAAFQMPETTLTRLALRPDARHEVKCVLEEERDFLGNDLLDWVSAPTTEEIEREIAEQVGKEERRRAELERKRADLAAREEQRRAEQQELELQREEQVVEAELQREKEREEDAQELEAHADSEKAERIGPREAQSVEGRQTLEKRRLRVIMKHGACSTRMEVTGIAGVTQMLDQCA